MDLLDGIDPGRLPRHVACVMDGNGRWATRRGLKRTEGHRMGEEALWDVVQGAVEMGLEWLTVYAFSTENWRRPTDEVRFLLNLNREILHLRRQRMHELGVRVRVAGRRDWRVPKRIIRDQDETMALTRDNKGLTFTLAFNYGGRAEIVDAVRRLVAEGVSPDDITEKAISRHLYWPDMPEPDLVIRTSGEYRVSNFLLWEIAYSEFVFTDVLWPDFTRAHLAHAIREYQGRTRRFGGIEA